MGSRKSLKNDPYLIFRGLGGGPKNGTPSRVPKSEILVLFITLELGPTSQKGTPFWLYFGDLFSQKNEKRGFQKRPKNQSQKTLKMGPKQGFFDNFGSFFDLWTLLGPTLLLERSWTSIFHHFGVTVPAFLCSSTLPGTAFLTFPPPQTGGGAKSFNTRGGALRKHFPCAAHSETLSSGPSPPKLGGGNFTFFVAVSACLFRQSTWRC